MWKVYEFRVSGVEGFGLFRGNGLGCLGISRTGSELEIMEKVKGYRVWTTELEADFAIHGLKMDQMLNFWVVCSAAC